MSKKKKKTLFSFVGSQDPFAPNDSDGPVLTIHGVNSYDRLILLHTSDDASIARAGKLRDELLRRGPANPPEVQLLPLEFDDPTDYRRLLPAMRELCPPLCEVDGNCHVSVASGSPAMHVCWFLLAAAGELPARILYLRRPGYARRDQPLIEEIDPREPPFPEVRPRQP